jgi:hypothetical protein
MKKKVDFLTVALDEQLGGPWHAGMAEEEAILMDSGQHPRNGLTLEMN